jgi:hypothetical protein
MRIVGWAEAMYAAIDAASQKDFAWGSHDCCMFAADILLAMTGVDYAGPVRGYTTQEEAQAIIDGYGGMEAMVTALIGVDSMDAKGKNVRRGDLVLMTKELGDTLGVCIGVNSVFVDQRGIAMCRTSSCRLSWRFD